MAKTPSTRSPGSLILEILIIGLLVILLLAIHSPKKQWEQQVQNSELCRKHMENIEYAAQLYNRVTKDFTSDINEIFSIVSAETLKVFPPGFKLERLTREESGIDSFQIDYFDPYKNFNHFEDIIDTLYPAGRDSIILTIKPRKRFNFLPETKYIFKAVAGTCPLMIDQLKRPTNFIFELKNPANLVTGHIVGKLSSTTLRLLDAYDTTDVAIDPFWAEDLDEKDKTSADSLWTIHVSIKRQAQYDSLLTHIVEDINELMRSDGIYDEVAFVQVMQSNETAQLLTTEQDDLERFCLNRRLLEEVYPEDIEKSPAPIINVQIDNRGEQGVFLMLGYQGRLRGVQKLGEIVRIHASKYIFNTDQVDFKKCSSSNDDYFLTVNVKLAIQAGLHCALEKEAPETSLVSSDRLTSLVVYRLLKESDALAKRDLVKDRTFEIIEDSLLSDMSVAFLDSQAEKLRKEGLEALADALYDSLLEYGVLPDSAQEHRWEAIRDSSYNLSNKKKEDDEFQQLVTIQVNQRKDQLAKQYLDQKLVSLRKEKTIDISESGVISTIMDSIDFYSDKNLIKERLFKAHKDSVTVFYMTNPDIIELLEQFSYIETYNVGRVDSIGVTIACPIEGIYKKASPSIFERIFSIEGEENHGKIENGDLSWSEKR